MGFVLSWDGVPGLQEGCAGMELHFLSAALPGFREQEHLSPPASLGCQLLFSFL